MTVISYLLLTEDCMCPVSRATAPWEKTGARVLWCQWSCPLSLAKYVLVHQLHWLPATTHRDRSRPDTVSLTAHTRITIPQGQFQGWPRTGQWPYSRWTHKPDSSCSQCWPVVYSTRFRPHIERPFISSPSLLPAAAAAASAAFAAAAAYSKRAAAKSSTQTGSE